MSTTDKIDYAKPYIVNRGAYATKGRLRSHKGVYYIFQTLSSLSAQGLKEFDNFLLYGFNYACNI